MQTNPDQWVVDFAHELWPMAQVGPSEGIEDAALRIAATIQAAFAEREARLVGAITSADGIACTPNGNGSHKITLHYPDTAIAMAAFVQFSDVADVGIKDRTHG